MNLGLANKLTTSLKPTISRYVPDIAAKNITPKQTIFCLCKAREAGYGGATGGGKSWAIMIDALQNIHVPGYSAILFRKTFADLAKEGALMDIAHEWFNGHPGVKWNERDKKWSFPTEVPGKTATISFGYMDSEKDKYNYAGAAYQYCAFDEATHFSLGQYTFMFSRMRKAIGLNVPVKVRSATNPGGFGHEWYKDRFLTPQARLHGRIFIPAGLKDNPNLDIDEYMEMLKELDPVTREMYINGNWDISESAGMFDRSMFQGKILGDVPKMVRIVRSWDTAATKPSSENPDPDWTVGALVGVDEQGNYWILDIVRFRETPSKTDQIMRATALKDGYKIKIWCEREPADAGKFLEHHLRIETFAGFDVGFYKPNKRESSKIKRAAVFASAAGYGTVYMRRDARWNEAVLSEAEMFPMGAHDDIVDAVSLAMQKLKKNTGDMFVGDAALILANGYSADKWTQIKAQKLKELGHTVGWNADIDEDEEMDDDSEPIHPYTAASLARGRMYNFKGGH